MYASHLYSAVKNRFRDPFINLNEMLQRYIVSPLKASDAGIDWSNILHHSCENCTCSARYAFQFHKLYRTMLASNEVCKYSLYVTIDTPAFPVLTTRRRIYEYYETRKDLYKI